MRDLFIFNIDIINKININLNQMVDLQKGYFSLLAYCLYSTILFIGDYLNF